MSLKGFPATQLYGCSQAAEMRALSASQLGMEVFDTELYQRRQFSGSSPNVSPEISRRASKTHERVMASMLGSQANFISSGKMCLRSWSMLSRLCARLC